MDSHLLSAGVFGVLVSVATGFIWSTEPYIFGLCSAITTYHTVTKKDRLIQYSNPPWTTLRFQISCVFLLYVCYKSVSFVPIGSYFSFDVWYFVNRLRIIYVFTVARPNFRIMVFLEIFFHLFVWYFGSFIILIISLLNEVGSFYKEVYFTLPEPVLQSSTDFFCFAIVPAMAVCFYGMQLITVVATHVWNFLVSFECVGYVTNKLFSLMFWS